MRKSLIVSISNAFGQKRISKNPKNKTQAKSTTQTQIPKDWKLVNLGGISFILPKSMEDKKAQGIDSAVWRFENDEIMLNIDSGMYSVIFDTMGFESNNKQVEINGVKGQFFTIDYTKPKSKMANDELSEDELQKPFLNAVVFTRGKNSYSSFWVQYKSSEQEEIAKQILQSIKFKKK